MAEGRKEAPAAWRARVGVAAGALVAGILGPTGSALAGAPAPEAAPQNLTPEEEAQQIAEMGNPPPDTGPADEAPPPDAEETPAGVPGSSDDELAQEPADDDGTPAPAPDVTPQATPAPPAPPPPPAAPAAPAAPVQQPQPVAQPQDLDVQPPPSTKQAKPRKHQSAPKARTAQPVPPHAVAPAPTASPAVAPASQAAATPASGARLHVVQAGESLWSIAASLLGDGATPAKIAALVDELWRLNVSRVGSGNPDMIHAGDQLLIP